MQNLWVLNIIFSLSFACHFNSNACICPNSRTGPPTILECRTFVIFSSLFFFFLPSIIRIKYKKEKYWFLHHCDQSINFFFILLLFGCVTCEEIETGRAIILAYMHLSILFLSKVSIERTKGMPTYLKTLYCETPMNYEL